MTHKLSLVLGLLSLACAIPTTATAAPMRVARGNYQVQVLVDGAPLKPYWHRGENWLLGQIGERYIIRVTNRTARPIEAVVSVDGRDVIDGETASPSKGGYLVPAWDHVDIDGWRISNSQAAAFRFSSVANSYAAQTGPAREVGVIGVAVFEQKRYAPPPITMVAPRPVPESCCMSGSEDLRRDGPDAKAPQLGGRADKAEPAPMAAPPSAQASAAPASPAERSAGPRALGQLDDSGDALGPSGVVGGVIGGDGRGSAGEGYRARAEEQAKKESRPGLGTEYGEAVDSQIRQVSFERATTYPAAILGARYNNRAGLLALGIDLGDPSEQVLRETAEPFPGAERGYAQPPPNWRR